MEITPTTSFLVKFSRSAIQNAILLLIYSEMDFSEKETSALNSKFLSVFFGILFFFYKAKFAVIAIATAKNFNAVEVNKKHKIRMRT